MWGLSASASEQYKLLFYSPKTIRVQLVFQLNKMYLSYSQKKKKNPAASSTGYWVEVL